MMAMAALSALNQVKLEDLEINLDIKHIIHSYPHAMLPTKLNPRTRKAKKTLFEKLDRHLYDDSANMVAFHTSASRIHSWIKTLHILYFDNLGKRPDLNVHWFDVPEVWVDPLGSSNSVVVEVRDVNESLIYGVTFFVTTGTIRAQGTDYKLFADCHFNILMQILSLVIDNSQAEQVPSSVNTNIESGDSDIENDTTVVMCDVSTPVTDHVAPFTDQTQLKSAIITPSEDVRASTPILSSSNTESSLSQLQSAILGTIDKIDSARSHDTEQIMNAIATSNKDSARRHDTEQILNAVATCNKLLADIHVTSKAMHTRASNDNSDLLAKIKQLEEHNSQYRDLLDRSRAEMHRQLSASSKEVEFVSTRLDQKNDEILALQTLNTDLKAKLESAYSEIISLKEHIGNTQQLPSNVGNQPTSASAEQGPPLVILMGTSNIEKIREDKISDAVKVVKFITYTLDEASAAILESDINLPRIVILHVLTNDLKHKSPSDCVDKLLSVTHQCQTKWPDTTVLVSAATPRGDDVKHHTNGQIINAMLMQKLHESDSGVKLIDHPRMYFHGTPDDNLLADDKYHLNDNGTSVLALDFKNAIHSTLNIPIAQRTGRMQGRFPGRRDRSNTPFSRNNFRGRGGGYKK